MYVQGVFILVFEKLKRNSSGVSSILCEILITGIVVLSLGSVFVFIGSIDKPVDPTYISIEEWVDAPSDTIYLRNAGGEPLDIEYMKINVDVGGISHVYSSANISKNLGGKSVWELADIIEINTSKEWGFSVPDEDELVVKLIDMDSREVLPKCRISLSPESSPSIDFEIKNGTVIPEDDFISSFTVLGAAIKSGYDQMVTTQFEVGNDTFNPWNYDLAVTGNVNDNKTHLWNLPKTYSAGTPVTIYGQSWLHGNSSSDYTLDSSWTSQRVITSTSNSSNCKILRNGDDVPLIPGSDTQPPITEFVADYVKDDKMVLGENEAIFLFELGVPEDNLINNSGADFQDLVVLLKVDSAPAS